MKKLLVLAFLFVIVFSAKGQSRIAEVNNNKYAIGFNLGAIGIGKSQTLFGFGFSGTIWGVYIDFLLHPNEHGTSTKVDKWNDEQGIATHIGYQIPISKHFRIIPMIGYGEVNKGVTDGSDYSISGGSVHNNYHATSRDGGFDFGTALVLNFGMLNIYATGTLWSLSAGIGIEF